MSAQNARKSKMIRDLLTERRFKNWLGKKRANETIGAVPNPFLCPISQYISENTKVEAIRTTKATLYCTASGVDIRESLPDWAREFITRIDAGGSRHVTAIEALDVFSVDSP